MGRSTAQETTIGILLYINHLSKHSKIKFSLPHCPPEALKIIWESNKLQLNKIGKTSAIWNEQKSWHIATIDYFKNYP